MAERTIAKPETEKKERIRGPNLRVLLTRANGVSFQKALEIADKENLVLASSKRITQDLVGADEWKNMRKVFACWSGTMTGYSKPEAKLGKFIEYTNPEDGQKYVFPVPEEYGGEKNAILVAEHPNYTLVPDGKNLVVQASEVDCIVQFPKNDGFYVGDSVHDIPTGEEVFSADQRYRYLFRVERRVGPVRRGDVIFGLRLIVDLADKPSLGLGAVVESPEGGAEAAPQPKAVLEIICSASEQFRALFKKVSAPEYAKKLRQLPREDLLRIAEEFAEALKGATLKD